MQVCKTHAISVDGEHRATVRTAARKCRPIEDVARQSQSGSRETPVGGDETMQGRESGAIRVDGEHRAVAGTALSCRPIQSGARRIDNQSTIRISAVAAVRTVAAVSKTM